MCPQVVNTTTKRRIDITCEKEEISGVAIYILDRLSANKRYTHKNFWKNENDINMGLFETKAKIL